MVLVEFTWLDDLNLSDPWVCFFIAGWDTSIHFSMLLGRLKKDICDNSWLHHVLNNSKCFYVFITCQILANAHLLNPYNNPNIQLLLLPFSRWRNWCREGPSHFLSFTQRACGWGPIPTLHSCALSRAVLKVGILPILPSCLTFLPPAHTLDMSWLDNYWHMLAKCSDFLSEESPVFDSSIIQEVIKVIVITCRKKEWFTAEPLSHREQSRVRSRQFG